jgi:hypothetical protein
MIITVSSKFNNSDEYVSRSCLALLVFLFIIIWRRFLICLGFKCHFGGQMWM